MALGLVGALPSLGGSAAIKGGLSSLALGANPISTGLGLLSGVGGLFGSKTKVSSASSNATSGVYASITFGDAGLIKKPFIDLENPVHVGVLTVLFIAGAVIYKKVKK